MNINLCKWLKNKPLGFFDMKATDFHNDIAKI